MVMEHKNWWSSKKQELKEFLSALLYIVPIAFVIRTFLFGLYVVPSGSMETTMLVGERFFSDKLSYLFREPRRGEILAFNDATFKYSGNKLIYLWQQYVWGPMNVTKRIIGLPGDHVQGKIENGVPVIYVNGEKFDEPYLNKYPLMPEWGGRAGASREDPLSFKSYDPKCSISEQPFYRFNQYGVSLARTRLAACGEETIRYPDTVTYSGNKIVDEFDVQLGSDEYWVMGDNRRGSADSRMWGPLKKHLIHGRILFRILSVDPDNPWLVLDILLHPIDFWRRVRWSRCVQFVS